MQLKYDSEVDAAYIELRAPQGNLAGSEAVGADRMRYLHYDEHDHVVAVELLNVSKGVDLAGIPEAERIAEMLRALGRAAPAVA